MLQHTSNVAVYAFVSWIASILIYVGFLVWALSSDEFLQSFGITYYPSRYYAISIPSYIMVVYFLIGLGYIGNNMMNTNDPTSTFTITDEFHQEVSAQFHKCSDTSEGIPDFGDIHPMEISRIQLDEDDFGN